MKNRSQFRHKFEIFLKSFQRESKNAQEAVREEEKSMKKKIGMLGLAMSLSMFGLVACGENAEEPVESTPVEVSVEAPEESVPAESTPAEAPAENEEPSEAEESSTPAEEGTETGTQDGEASTQETETSTAEGTTEAAE